MENIKKFNFYRLNIVKCYIDPYLNYIESFHQIDYIDIIFKFIILALFYTRVHKFLTDHNIMIIYDEYKCLSKWKKTIGKYFLQMRNRLALKEIDSLQTKLIAGPWEADETWCRVKRKFNRGRIRKRAHAMVFKVFIHRI